MASASLSLRMPVAASIAAWARLPWTSWAWSRLSNEIEALIAVMIASGPAANRPPHIVLVFAGCAAFGVSVMRDTVLGV